MERIDEILTKLREFAERNVEGTRIEIKMQDVIRIVDYIDKLEDAEMYLKMILSNNSTQVNINN